MIPFCTFVLAGGKGERLSPLTDSRAKPVLPFLGCHRLIDFTLLSCIQSGISQVHVLTRNDCLPLDIGTNESWREAHVQLLQKLDGPSWMDSLQRAGYAGTADAVRQNLARIPRGADEVLILASDHIYSMDYQEILAFHRHKGAMVTVAASKVDWSEADRFGILEVDGQDRVYAFLEKPSSSEVSSRGSPKALASMGIYVFNRHFLSAVLRALPEDDFGRHILPPVIESGQVFAFHSSSDRPQDLCWRDVGTMDSYWDSQVGSLTRHPLKMNGQRFNGYRAGRFGGLTPIQTNGRGNRIRKYLRYIYGKVTNSVVSETALICSGAEVSESIVLERAVVMPGARLRRAIVDRRTVVPPFAEIGFDREKDNREYVVSQGGVVVVTPERAPACTFPGFKYRCPGGVVAPELYLG